MAPCAETALQSAPVPVLQQFVPVQERLHFDPLKLPGHAPTHPNSAVCSALRSAGQNLDKSYVLIPHRIWEASQKSPVVVVQSMEPQAQPPGMLFPSEPSVTVQVGTVVSYRLPKGTFDAADALAALQSRSKAAGIAEWSLAQPSLEEVFVNIANRYTRD